MPMVEKLLVYLASPGDVRTERRYVDEVVDEIKRMVAPRPGVVLQTVRHDHLELGRHTMAAAGDL